MLDSFVFILDCWKDGYLLAMVVDLDGCCRGSKNWEVVSGITKGEVY